MTEEPQDLMGKSIRTAIVYCNQHHMFHIYAITSAEWKDGSDKSKIVRVVSQFNGLDQVKQYIKILENIRSFLGDPNKQAKLLEFIKKDDPTLANLHLIYCD